jgi:hypothetical protein
MFLKTFKSSTSRDEVEIILIKKSHKAIFNIKVLDDIMEHIKLISVISQFLKKEDIKWVEIEKDFDPKIPQNTISYINKYNGHFVCHIEDFERFYLSNIENFIKINFIYVNPSKISDDGWTRIMDPKRERKDKYNKLKKDAVNLVGDWNILNL